MSKVVLRIYIPRRAKVDVRSWRHFGRKQSLSLYLFDKALEPAIGEAELSHVMAGYVGGDREHPTRRTRDIPDCLDIRERQEDLRALLRVVPQALGYEHHSLAHPRAIRNVVSLDAGAASDSLLRRDS